MGKILDKIKTIDFERLVYHEQKIGGLAVTDKKISLTFLEYLEDKNGREIKQTFQKEVDLPAGAIEAGILKSESQFLAALGKLLADKKDFPSPFVVASLPANVAQPFSLELLPDLKEDELDKAVSLQALSLLPLREEEIYFDWEEIKKSKADKKRILLAMGVKNKIAPYLEAIKKAGLTPVACETSGWSLAREMEFQGEPTLAVVFEPEQAVFLAYQDDAFVFQFDLPKKILLESGSGAGEKAGLKDAKGNILKSAAKGGGGDLNPAVARLADYAGKIIKFLAVDPKYGFEIKSVLLLKDPSEEKEIYDLFKERVKAENKDVSVTIIDASAAAFFSRGAAKRGLLPRGRDVFSSLMPVGTEEAYEKQRLVSFVGFFQTFVVSLLGFFIVLFIAALAIVGIISRAAANELEKQQVSIPPEFDRIKNAVKIFNSQTENLSQITQAAPKWNKLFVELDKIINSGLTVKNLEISAEGPVVISGVAKRREDLIELKDALEKSAVFSTTPIPLSALVGKENIDFSIKLQLKNPGLIY